MPRQIQERDTTKAPGVAPIVTVVGGAVGAVILLAAVVSTLILIVVCLVRKCEKKLKNKEIRKSVTNTKAMDGVIEMDANLSYVPIFHQISTDKNIAYGEVRTTEGTNNLYEIMEPPMIEDGTTQLSHNELSGENTIEYDYVNYST